MKNVGLSNIGAAALSLTYSELLSQRQISCRYVHALDIVIIATSGHAKEAAHLTDAVLFLMSVNDFILDAGLHSFPENERKSRNSSFSIFKRRIS